MKKLVKLLEQQTVLDRMAEYVKPRINTLLERTGKRQQVADFLNGVWLGHPLHPVLTDVPIGAWTTAAVFDASAMLTGHRSKAATGAIALGIAASVPTAAAGVMDWYNLNPRQTRVGAGHALMNSAALALYSISLGCRLTGFSSGRLPALLGLGFLTASAYVGGYLVYNERVGVRRASEEEMDETFSPAGSAADMADGSPRRTEVDGVPVLLARADGQFYAVADTCTHLACSLSEGRVEGTSVVCSCHGSRFNLTDGSVLEGPATQPLATYDVRLQDGRIEVRAKSGIA